MSRADRKSQWICSIQLWPKRLQLALSLSAGWRQSGDVGQRCDLPGQQGICTKRP